MVCNASCYFAWLNQVSNFGSCNENDINKGLHMCMQLFIIICIQSLISPIKIYIHILILSLGIVRIWISEDRCRQDPSAVFGIANVTLEALDGFLFSYFLKK